MNNTSSEPPMRTYLSQSEGSGKRGGGLDVADGDPSGGAVARSQYLEVANRILSGLTWVVLGVVLLFWAIFGAIFWIPLMVRAMLRFSINLIESMFEGVRPVEAGRILRNAVSFYRRGFVVAIEVVTREDLPEDPKAKAQQREDRLLLEVVWAILVWYFLFLWFGWIQTSPVDMWHWFVSQPWGAAWRGFLDLIGLGG